MIHHGHLGSGDKHEIPEWEVSEKDRENHYETGEHVFFGLRLYDNMSVLFVLVAQLQQVCGEYAVMLELALLRYSGLLSFLTSAQVARTWDVHKVHCLKAVSDNGLVSILQSVHTNTHTHTHTQTHTHIHGTH